MVAMITPPSVMEMNERRKPVPKNRRRIQASVKSSNVIAASAPSTAAWYWGMRNGSVCRTPPRNVPEPVIAQLAVFAYQTGLVAPRAAGL